MRDARIEILKRGTVVHGMGIIISKWLLPGVVLLSKQTNVDWIASLVAQFGRTNGGIWQEW